MSGAYYYLISTLPLLRLDEAPPFDSATFLELCKAQLGEPAALALAQVSLTPEGDAGSGGVEQGWNQWESWLRNQLVRSRASKRGLDAEAHLRPETDAYPGAQRQVDEAMAAKNPAVRERMLDELRWQRLDELASGHAFDFEVLVLYRLRLLLVEKQQAMRPATALEVANEAVASLIAAAAAKRTVVTS